METLNKLKKILNNNRRYGLAFLVMAVVFCINEIFPADTISSKNCAKGNCPMALENPVLTDKKPTYYINDILESQGRGFYRLSFWERSTKDSLVNIKLSTSLDEYQNIKTLELKKSFKDDIEEIVFKSSGQFTDLIFEKNNSEDGSEISISNVLLTKLDISDEKELNSLKKTMRGEVDFDVLDQKQSDRSKDFSQLIEPNILGQIFKPQVDYISAILLDMDVIKQGNNGDKKYRLELREADFDGETADISPDTAIHLSFSLSDLDKFRQENGQYKFPLFYKLDRDKYYFIGINSGRADVNKFNYIKLKGSGSAESYEYGKAVVKRSGRIFSAGGNLYFATFGIKLKELNDHKILLGTVIEDIGKGQGKYNYQPGGNIYDLADLNSATKDVFFDYSKNIIAGSSDLENNSSYIYKFDTIYPFKKIEISAQQADVNWSQVSLSYSLDGRDWQSISSCLKEEISGPKYEVSQFETFNLVLSPDVPREEIFLRVEPKERTEKNNNYGIRNLKIEADLTIK